MATNKTKFFRVAVEGATVDGREIKREWLTQMAKNYNRELYSARLNIEHLKGWAPLSATNPFGAYGDVVALKATEIEDGPLKGKMGLYAQLDPTDELVALSKKRQKIFTSIEVNPDFADIGEAYLVGLAATDDPASLGTEALQFAARRSNNLFSAACETAIEFDGEPESTSLLSIVKGMFARNRTTDDQRDADVRRAVEEVAGFASQQGRDIAALRVDLTAAQKRADEAVAAVEALTAKLSATDNGAPRRQPSTGSTGELVTDC
ncbi:GPO family capsid scaffolding protein [Burkholderia stagnalis]|uniref:GPO family capsid scaffolding protein n=1 Tax=Burkholderia stagnalis TaxID=1503054 RepID=A0A6L3N3B1_9BURK|nr:GPO family capsid scaffolding protein [Burkholderia stagnalis]KAB0640846.1 GPO family capsid scaffolding protein [Burkholderia stagnalis]KVO46767.1 GPO family capsid scaffolding protein [Burkholderia stagnalis]KVO68186.1 GPO family capsid scaffolding protein [Burkholderia stagnalis]KVW66830.1 GPO family capsid scaffolding protein [Burkholderia stagnalis]KVW80125.1 GPO family capsid scaffolding protein [Burkholderia stagnalis]